MKTAKTLIVVVGPTAVGKTNLCLDLATKLNTEIVSADSRQFFKEMNIGTAKPNSTELALVKHYFINSHSVKDDYDVRSYEKEAVQTIDEIFTRKDTILLTGGSGLYIKAVCEGLDDMPDIPNEFREKVIADYENNGLAFLQAELKVKDPTYYEIVDLNNPQRLMRALEVCRFTQKTFSSFRVKKKVIRPFNILKIGLERPREELYERINTRMDVMLKEGLLEEVKSLINYKHYNALQTLGYQEIFSFLDNKYDWEETVRLLKQNSRRYAKRQLTWFKKDTEIHWFSPKDIKTIYQFVTSQLKSFV